MKFVVTFLLLFALAPTATRSQEPAPLGTIESKAQPIDEFLEVLQAKAELKEREINGNPFFTAVADIGSVKPNTKIRVQLTLANPESNETVVFDKASTSCSCSKFLSPQSRFQSGTDSIAIVEFKTPKAIAAGKIGNTVLLRNEGRVIADLRVNCVLEGNLFIAKGASVILLDEEKEFLIPFEFSSPVTHETVELEVDEALKDFEISKVKIDGRSYIRLIGTKSLIQDENLVGSITLRDRRSNRDAMLSLYLYKQSLVKITPHVIRFSKSNETGLVASAIMRVETKPSNGKVKVFAKFSSGEVIEVKAKRMSEGIFRLKLTAESVPNDGNATIKWDLVGANHGSELGSSFVVKEY